MLGAGIESIITDDPRTFLLGDGRLDIRKVLDGFTDFWIENGEILVSHQSYTEAAAQLVFMAYLQRIATAAGVSAGSTVLAGAGSTSWSASSTEIARSNWWPSSSRSGPRAALTRSRRA